MSHRSGTVGDMSVEAASGGPSGNGTGTAPGRWRLHRAGIVNVYQYENEVLHFGGGRLLLRGVNGSGKSTAMNMLLPFLLTARQGRIDAAGEQSGILKSWMLNGRNDPQPVGYLWIEFERRGEYLTCGCGIKANRQSDTVTTWWFVTSKRPGIDVTLAERGSVPLSADGLRVALDGDEVFGERRRRDYRREVEHRLFGGASIDQHIGLINVVRSPRVGDRIDVDLPAHLLDALPQLSEQALAEAAQPLDDLEEHRRNVAELARTSAAIRGLLDVYRSYCVHELRRRVTEGRDRLGVLRRCTREEKARQRAAEAAAAEVQRLDVVIGDLDGEARRLRSEIAALEESQVYRSGQDLDALRDLVAELAGQRASGAERVADCQRRLATAGGQVKQAQHRGRDDRTKLNDDLATAAGLGERCGVAQRPPGPVAVSESPIPAVDVTGSDGRDEAGELAEPGETFDTTSVERRVDAAGGAVLQRRADVEEVEKARGRLDTAEEQLSRAEAALDVATKAARRAADRLAERTRLLGAARREWAARTGLWASEVHPLLRAAVVDAPTAAHFADLPRTSGADAPTAVLPSPFPRAADVGAPTVPATDARPSVEDTPALDDHEAVRARLLAEADNLVNHWRDAVAGIDFRLAGEREAADEAQALVTELAARTEPDPPRLGWQSAAEHCLADLVDFAPHLGHAERAGIEAALESSGLLSARLVNGGAVELANGDLVAIVAGGVPSPLSNHLTVTLPDRLVGDVDEGLVAKLLESISCDTSSGATTAVGTDGTFRIGSLSGRHSKEQAEFIGVTARRGALDRARQEAAERLEQARAVVSRSEAERADHQASLDEAVQHRSELPATNRILTALAEADAAADTDTVAGAEKAAAAERAAEAERESIGASDALQRVATTLALPADRDGLHAVGRDLGELSSVLDRCRSRLDTLRRSVDDWRSAADRRRTAVGDLGTEQDALVRIDSKHSSERARLVTIEDSIGDEYAAVVATRDHCKAELDEVETRLPATRSERDSAVEQRAESQAAARSAAARRAEAAQACEAMRLTLTEVLATPGLVDAVEDQDATAGRDGLSDRAPAAPAGAIVARSAGADGLREMIDAVEHLLPAGPDDATGAPAVSVATAGSRSVHRDTTGLDAARAGGLVHPIGADVTSADSVRQSLRQRRDALGAGWDAEARQPDPALPLVIDVTGPSGRAPLAASVRAVSRQHRQLAGLLNRKQDDALRELLQGLIAREIAEKVHGADRLVRLMNQRLDTVATAHEVGVRLRWRRSPELDPTTARMVDLLATRPDLRLEEDERELRRALSDRLDEARALQPDVPYRQLIADTLDYKQWHEMSVMLRREGGKETRLNRRTPLSEGEKKIVTYLPLFAAVAASYDALAEQQGTPDGGRGDIARFVLLDDAFAKVSEDNHASLFGLLVALDLDLIATSERLWGTHATVPELAITEVIRDANLGMILLEHYRWDGATLERSDTP